MSELRADQSPEEFAKNLSLLVRKIPYRYECKLCNRSLTMSWEAAELPRCSDHKVLMTLVQSPDNIQ